MKELSELLDNYEKYKANKEAYSLHRNYVADKCSA